jgi:nitrous oxide reductase
MSRDSTEVPGSSQLDRREFLRMAALIGTAAAAGGAAYPGVWRSMAVAAGIPPLTTSETITGIAAGPDRLIAVWGSLHRGSS